MRINSNSSLVDCPSLFGRIIERWTSVEVRLWLEGLGESVPRNYLDKFKNIDGDLLLSLVSEDLEEIGIHNLGARRKILSSIARMLYLCYDAENENLQNLIALLGVQARNFYNELKRHLNARKIQPAWPDVAYNKRFPKNFAPLCSKLAEQTKKLLSWFDRPPFVEDSKYANLRHSIWTITLDILDWKITDEILTEEQRKQFITSLQISCAQLYNLCDRVVQENSDILMIQNAYFSRCELSRKSHRDDIGLSLDTSDNVHFVKEIKFGSPADLSRKIDIGDEIVDINGQAVVGWTHDNVTNYISSLKPLRVSFLLKKLPHPAWNIYKIAPSTPRVRKITGVVSSASPASVEPNFAKLDNSIKSRQTIFEVDGSSGSSSKNSTCSVATVRKDKYGRRRSSTFSGEFKMLGSSETSARREHSYIKRRKWKTVKAPTVPLNKAGIYGGRVDQNLPRTRRATVSGGSPILKRLSLHVHSRKCSLMPQAKSAIASGRSFIDASDLSLLESPSIKHQLNKLYLHSLHACTASSSAADGDDQTSQSGNESFAEDDVFLAISDKTSTCPAVSDVATSVVDFLGGPRKSTGDGRKQLNSLFDSQKTINAAEYIDADSVDFSTVIPADESRKEDCVRDNTEWVQQRQDTDEEQKTNQKVVLRGIVDFDGPVQYPSTLPLSISKRSRKKVENFFGENLNRSVQKIYNLEGDTLSVTSSGSGGSQLISSHASSHKDGSKSPSMAYSLLTKLQKHYLHKSKESFQPDDSVSSTGSQASIKYKHPSLLSFMESWRNSDQNLNSQKRNTTSFDYAAHNQKTLKDTFFSLSNNNNMCNVTFTGNGGNFHNGWLFRFKLPNDRLPFENNRQSRWRKRWAVLQAGIFCLYRTTNAEKKLEGIICTNGCQIRPVPSSHLGSSKKHIFEVYCQSVPFYFYCSKREDMLHWLKILGLSAIGYDSCSDSSASVNKLQGFYFDQFDANGA